MCKNRCEKKSAITYTGESDIFVDGHFRAGSAGHIFKRHAHADDAAGCCNDNHIVYRRAAAAGPDCSAHQNL